MAKSKVKSKRVSKPRRKQLANPRLGLDQHAIAHARMLDDPCDSMLEESVYPGDRGYVQRFVANASYGAGAGATAWFAVWKPGNIVSTNFDSVTSGVTNALSFQKASWPGAAFLAGNTSKTRAVSFCMTFRPVASANNATGTIHFGVVNAQTFINGGSLSPDIIASYCTNSVSAAQALINPLEVKWCPGGFDDRYCATTSLSDDDSDRNVLIVCGIGFPPATGVQYRATAIVEWAPTGSSGVMQDATSVGKSHNTIHDVTRALKQKNANWWWQLGKSSMNLTSKVIGGYAAGGAVGALGAAVRYF